MDVHSNHFGRLILASGVGVLITIGIFWLEGSLFVVELVFGAYSGIVSWFLIPRIAFWHGSAYRAIAEGFAGGLALGLLLGVVTYIVLIVASVAVSVVFDVSVQDLAFCALLFASLPTVAGPISGIFTSCYLWARSPN